MEIVTNAANQRMSYEVNVFLIHWNEHVQDEWHYVGNIIGIIPGIQCTNVFHYFNGTFASIWFLGTVGLMASILVKIIKSKKEIFIALENVIEKTDDNNVISFC